MEREISLFIGFEKRSSEKRAFMAQFMAKARSIFGGHKRLTVKGPRPTATFEPVRELKSAPLPPAQTPAAPPAASGGLLDGFRKKITSPKNKALTYGGMALTLPAVAAYGGSKFLDKTIGVPPQRDW